MEKHTARQSAEYVKPQVTDYGDLRALTAANVTGNHVDVPKGTPVPPFSIFSA